MSELGEYTTRLSHIISKSRNDAWLNIVLGIVFLVVNVGISKHGTWIYVFVALFGIQVVFGALRAFHLRAKSPVVAALHDPKTLVRVHGWPYAGGKYPPGKVPSFLIATAPGGAKVRLKVGDERELRGFIAALRDEAPQLDIAVPNVDAPKAA